jgi:polyhydroxyalkanoate synthesis regulator phasin
MIDAIKKTLLAGVGAAVVTKEKVEAVLQDFVRQGKVTAEEARATAEKIADQGRHEFEETSARLSGKIDEVFARFNRSTQARIDAIELRVRALEEKTTPPPAADSQP